MNRENQNSRPGRFRNEIPFILGLILTGILALADFTILGHDFGTDAWKSQYPWAELYPVELVRTVNYDSVMEHRPWLEFARNELNAGRLPLWNPYSFAGTPLYANHLVPVLYPLLTICLFAFEGDDIAGWLAVLHIIIFGLSLYAFLRALGIKPMPAFITACAAQFTGICFVLWHPWAVPVAWAPAILALYEGYRLTRKRSYIGWAALVYGIALMAAFPVMMVHFSYFLFIYILIRELTGPGRKPLSAIPVFVVIVLLGAIISGVQNIPTFIYSTDTYRSVFYEHSVKFLDAPAPPEAMEPERWGISETREKIVETGMLIAPVPILRLFDNKQFLGAPLLLFSIFGLFLLPPGRRYWALLFVAFYAAGYVNIVYAALMKTLPLWNIRAYEPREIWLLCALVCSGYGLQSILDGSAVKLRVPLKAILTAFSIILVAAVGVVLTIVGLYAPGFFPIETGWLFGACVLYFVCAAIIAIACHTGLYSGWTRPGYFIAIILTAIISAGIPSRILALPYTSDASYFSPPNDRFIAEINKASGPDGRVARITDERYYLNLYRRAKVPLFANITTQFGIRDVSGYDSLIPRRTVDYLNLIEKDTVKSLRVHLSFNDQSVLGRDLFRALGVGCVISDLPALPVESRAVRVGGLYFHHLQYASPRYYLARSVSLVDNPENVKPLLLHDGWLDKGKVYVDASRLTGEERTRITMDKGPDSNIGSVTKTAEIPTRISFQVKSEQPELLVLNDTYAPGWIALVDGKRARCLNANYLFRAVYVPDGEHTVEFVYRPSYMVIGLLSTITGLVIFIGLLIKRRPGQATVLLKKQIIRQEGTVPPRANTVNTRTNAARVGTVPDVYPKYPKQPVSMPDETIIETESRAGNDDES